MSKKETSETKATESNPVVEKKKVKVLFKNTYIGEHGIFYKKNKYTIANELAEILKDDIEVL